MSANEIHKGDVGTTITFTVKDSDTSVDLSAAVTKSFLLKAPGGTLTTIAASFTTSGTNGSIYFTTMASHFDTTGTYKLQALVTDVTGSWRTDVYEFFVHPNLE